jgi:hypothetical protein
MYNRKIARKAINVIAAVVDIVVHVSHGLIKR